MQKETRVKLLNKPMTRREFLQFAGSSLLVLFGLGNVLAVLDHAKKTAESPEIAQHKAKTGFGASKFGV